MMNNPKQHIGHWYPFCVNCKTEIKHHSGKTVSVLAYLSLNGQCNNCLQKEKEIERNAEAENKRYFKYNQKSL